MKLLKSVGGLIICNTALLTLLNNGSSNTVSAFGLVPSNARKATSPTAFRPFDGRTTSPKWALMAEPIRITMPALSSTMTEGKIVSWLKSEGEEVSAGEPIMVVESDKADMDVEAFEDGYLAAILKEEGESAEVGAPVGIIVENEADIAVVQAGPVAAAPAAAAPAAAAPAAASAVPECGFSQINMPALSSTMKEGKVVSWLKAEGDAISSGEPIMVVESDKADMDVESFEDGFLAAIITEEGEASAVGAPVALIADNEEDIPVLKAYAATLSGAPVPAAAAPAAAAAAPAPAAKAAAPAPTAAASASGDRVVASPLAKKLAIDLGVDISTVQGTGPSGRITAADIEAASKPVPGEPAAAETAKPSHVPLPGVIAATPTARALAKKAKLDLSTIKGTGQFGRVTADDVKLATGEKKPEKKKVAPPGQQIIEMPDAFVPFTGMQRGVSNNMEATLSTPVFRCTREIEMDAFDDLYQKLKPKGVSVSSLLSRAVGLAVQKHPIINSSYKDGGIQYNPDINVAMAVAIDGGLITPTLRNADEKDVFQLGAEWRDLVDKAKDGKLSPEEYTTGTIVISNLGMFGITQFDAILPKGMGAILAIGATQEKVVPDKKAVLGLKTVKRMTVTITCDHRQIYGADAALFMKTLADIMEKPEMLS